MSAGFLFWGIGSDSVLDVARDLMQAIARCLAEAGSTLVASAWIAASRCGARRLACDLRSFDGGRRGDLHFGTGLVLEHVAASIDLRGAGRCDGADGQHRKNQCGHVMESEG